MIKLLRQPFYLAIFLLMLPFFLTCFFGTYVTVKYNVTTIVYGDSIIPTISTYLFQLIIGFIFLKSFNKFQLIRADLFRLMLFFILWTALVSFLANDKFLTNIKYSFYFLVFFIGVSKFKNNFKFIKVNIWILQLIGISILVFSVIIIIEHPIPAYRTYRSSVMHSNANEDALILTASLPFMFLIKNKKMKIIIILYYFYYLILYNSTRSAIVISSIVALIMLFEILKKYRWLLLLSLIVFSINLLGTIRENVLNDPLFTEGISAIENREDGNMSGRIFGILIPLYEYTIDKSPIWGFGAKSYENVASHSTFYVSESGKEIAKVRSPHNFFIMFFLNWGFVGLITFLIIYFRYIYISYKIFKFNKNSTSSSLFSSWIAFSVMNFISNSFSYRGWTVFILLLLTTHFLNKYFLHINSSQDKHEILIEK